MREFFRITIIITILSISFVNSVMIEDQSVDIVRSIMEKLMKNSSPQLFEAYHFLYNKLYAINSEEGIKRKKIFESNIDFIKSSNEKTLLYKLGVTDFTDMSREEFRQTHLTTKKEDVDAILKEIDNEKYYSEYTEPFNSLKSIHIGEEISLDWSGNFRQAVNQGGCGCCWAYSTAGAIEGNYNIAFPHTNKVAFSPQSLVDCDTTNNGCNGGNIERSMKHVIANGIPYEYSYLYRGVEQTCNKEIAFNKIVTSYERCRHCTTEQYRGLLSKGPLSVFIDGDGEGIFQHYVSGVLEMPCSEINHCVITVGVEADAEGNGYYKGRNSWGTKWGEDGYFRLKIGSSKESCYLENVAVLPNVVESSIPIPDPPEPECAKIYSECSLKGNSFDVCDSNPELPASVSGASQSFTIGKYTRALLFSDVRCTGTNYTRSSNWICIATDKKVFNSLKSILVGEDPVPPSNCVWLYEGSCFTGEKLEACTTISSLASVGWANRIGSVAVGGGIQYTIHTSSSKTTRTTNYYGLSSTYYKKVVKLTIVPLV